MREEGPIMLTIRFNVVIGTSLRRTKVAIGTSLRNKVVGMVEALALRLVMVNY